MAESFYTPQRFVSDSDQFTPPTAGGAVAVKYASIAYTDTTAANLFTLPAGAVIVGWLVNVTTAFNGSSTDLLDIGTSADGDAYANDLDVASTGQQVTGFIVGGLFTELTEETQITATYADAGGDASAGAATVCCFYITR